MSKIPKMAMAMPSGAGRSRKGALLKLAALIAVFGGVALWLKAHPMSPGRLFALGLLTAALLVWAGLHRRNGRRLLVVAVEWGLVAGLVVALTGGHPDLPQPAHGKHAKHATAGAEPVPGVKSLQAACRKVDTCATVLDWFGKQQAARDAKAKPARKAKR